MFNWLDKVAANIVAATCGSGVRYQRPVFCMRRQRSSGYSVWQVGLLLVRVVDGSCLGAHRCNGLNCVVINAIPGHVSEDIVDQLLRLHLQTRWPICILQASG